MICGYMAVAVIVISPKYANQIWDWRDYAALTAFFMLMAWLFTPLRSTSLVGADGHESTRNSFSFRLGKSLQRIWRGFRR